jgi:hypothetical protein
MEADSAKQPISAVTGQYLGMSDRLELLTVSTPLTRDEVRRTFARMVRVRNFSMENGGYTSQVFEIRIAESTDVRE